MAGKAQDSLDSYLDIHTMINAFKMQRSIATLTFLSKFQRNLVHVQRSNNVVETTESEGEIPKFDTLENNAKCHNTGAETKFMDLDQIQTLYNAITERVNQPGYNPSNLEKKLLAGVIYHNPNYDEGA